MVYDKHNKPASIAARRWFAWYPVDLIDGRTAWLTYVNRYVNREQEYIIYYPIDGVTK